MTQRKRSDLFLKVIRLFLHTSLFLFFLLFVLQETKVWASDFDTAFQRGMTLYQKKEYEAAIEAFKESYKIKQFPRVLLNIAQVYRKMGQARLALDYYEQYLQAEPKMPAKLRADVEQYIVQTKAALEATSLSDDEERRMEPSPTGFDKASGNILAGHEQAMEAKRVRKKRILFGAIAGSAAAAAIIGIGLGVGLYQRNKLPSGITIFEY